MVKVSTAVKAGVDSVTNATNKDLITTTTTTTTSKPVVKKEVHPFFAKKAVVVKEQPVNVPVPENTNLQVVSWNVNGLRSVLKDEALTMRFFNRVPNADFVFFQETKLDDSVVPTINFPNAVKEQFPFIYWSCCKTTKGYSGLCLLSKYAPVSVRTEDLNIPADNEGRVICADFGKFYLVNCYVPNSGQKLDRLTFRTTNFEPQMRTFLNSLKAEKNVIYSGDLNVAPTEKDVYDSKKCSKYAGHTPEEREAFRTFEKEGWVDVFRHQNPDKVQYSFWSARGNSRSTNQGWRLDFFMVPASQVETCGTSEILDDVMGSDHCPVSLTFKN